MAKKTLHLNFISPLLGFANLRVNRLDRHGRWLEKGECSRRLTTTNFHTRRTTPIRSFIYAATTRNQGTELATPHTTTAKFPGCGCAVSTSLGFVIRERRFRCNHSGICNCEPFCHHSDADASDGFPTTAYTAKR